MNDIKYTKSGELMKSNRVPIVFLIMSICLIVVGYFLWTILIPIQEIDLMSKVELLALQKEVAINYDLGKIMMLVGAIGIFCSLGLIIRKNKEGF